MAKKKTLAQRIAADPKLKKKYLANPGLRSKLDASALTPAQRKTRATNTYNKTPITPGSPVTNADVAREADTATMVQFGGAGRELQTAQAREQAVGRDTAGWYDAYRKELQAHAANTQGMNAAAVGQIGALGAGMRGLDQTALTTQQTAANADAATRGASAANLGPDASNASLVRQQMIANYGVEQVGLGAAASRNADTRANVVAPTQKLQAQMGSAQRVRDVGNQITTLKEKAGAYNQNYRDTRRSDEAKNVLANAALTNDIAKTKSTAELGAARIKATTRGQDLSAEQSGNRLAETTRSHRANETAAQARIRIAREKASKGTALKPATREAHAKTKNDIDSAQAWIRRLRKAKGKDGKPFTDAQIRDTLSQGLNETDPKTKKHTKIPALSNDAVNAALSLIDNGELTPADVKALHRAGISIRQLGYPTTGARHKKAGKKPLKQLASDLDQARKALRP